MIPVGPRVVAPPVGALTRAGDTGPASPLGAWPAPGAARGEARDGVAQGPDRPAPARVPRDPGADDAAARDGALRARRDASARAPREAPMPAVPPPDTGLRRAAISLPDRSLPEIPMPEPAGPLRSFAQVPTELMQELTRLRSAAQASLAAGVPGRLDPTPLPAPDDAIGAGVRETAPATRADPRDPAAADKDSADRATADNDDAGRRTPDA